MVSFRFSFTLMGGCPCLQLWFRFSLINLLFWGVVPRFCFWLIIRTFVFTPLVVVPFQVEGVVLALQFSCFFLCPFLLFVDDVDRGTSSCI